MKLWLSFWLVFLLWSCADKKPAEVDVDNPPNVEDSSLDYNSNTKQSVLDSFFIGNAPVFITEVASFNASYKDFEGNDPGWIELYNPHEIPVDMSGYALTDRFDQKRRWVFGNVIVPPQTYITVFMSKKNLVDMPPPQEDINLLTEFAYSWADGQNDPPGNSEVWFNYFPESVTGLIAGKRGLSATLMVGDNSRTQLGWTASKVVMNFLSWNGKESIDFGQRGVVELKGYLQKGKRLGIRLAQADLEEWESWVTYIDGTGDSNGVYTIELPKSGYPDISALWALVIEAPAGQDTISFVFNDIRALGQVGYPHTNFKLSKKGGYLWLSDPDGFIRDTLSYPELGVDMSWAMNSAGQWGYQDPCTPSEANEVVFGQKGSRVIAALDEGFYPEPVLLELNTQAGENIYYTTDGSEPNLNSQLYSQAIAINKTTVVRMRSIPDQGMPGPVESRTYFIADQTTVPVISIAVDPHTMFDPDTGIYSMGPNAEAKQPHFGANFWKDIEISANVSLFEANGQKGFSAPAGLKIFGNWSKSFKKKSLSLHFREKYGLKSLTYPVFPQHKHLKEFKSLVLRNGGNNTERDYLRDHLAVELAQGLQIDCQNYRPAVVYINGEYWGIYGLREKSNSNYIPTNYGYDKSVVNMLLAGGSLKRGSAVDWRDFAEWLETADMNATANRERVRATIDMDNFMDYLSLELFTNNTDWPGNNMKFWSAVYPHNRWRWIMYDMDFGFDSYAGGNARPSANFNTYNFITATNGPDWPNGPQHTLLFRKLFEDMQFVEDFSNRMAVLLSWHFTGERINGIIDNMLAALGNEPQRDQQRWNLKASTFKEEEQKIRNFAMTRPGYLRDFTRQQFDLGPDVSATLQSAGGFIQVNGLTLPLDEFHGTWYADQALRLKAVAPTGRSFAGWSDGETAAERLWVPVPGGLLVANFD